MLATLGRYEVLRPIATGGMATVYLGRVNAAGGFERLVAIKVMHPHIALEADFVTMFLDEARLAARIRHPNVVATHDVDEGPDGLFLVMDYVEGAPLHMVVKAVARARQVLPPDVLMRIFCDVLEGLHAAHELTDENGRHLGLVHRDVSPHNVLVGADGVSRITDFGVAHARTRLTSTRGTNLKGKVAYLSPEQVLVGRVDRRSDVFSAGVVLWEALTRRRLFKGETEGQTLAQIIGGVRTSPAQVDARIPQSISDVCMKALQGDANVRFQTAIEFADALEAAARSAGITIAKARQVSAFLSTLDVPEASLKVPVPPSSASASAPRSPESVQRIATALAAIAQPREPEPAGHDLPPASSTEPSGTVGGSLVDLTPPPTRGRGRGLFVALAVLLALGAAAAVVIAPRLRSVSSRAPAAVAAVPTPPPQPSETPAPVASTEPAPSPPPSAAAAEAPPKAEPGEKPSGSDREAARPALTGPVQPRVPKPSATSYKPSEL